MFTKLCIVYSLLLKIHYCCQLKLKKIVKTKSILILTTKLSKWIFKKFFNRLLLILDPFINNLRKIQNSTHILKRKLLIYCFLHIFLNFIMNVMLILISNQYYHKNSKKSIMRSNNNVNFNNVNNVK